MSKLKCEAPRPSRQDGTGTAGPFDRALGPEHVEGLPGRVISLCIVPLDLANKARLTGHVPLNRKFQAWPAPL